uniref:Uncharacterized protein n=1 Tax=Anopheles dirus TaxID=7168 RepID=A0A182NMU8_9DIPT
MKSFDCTAHSKKYLTVIRCDVETSRNRPQMLHMVAKIIQPISKIFISTGVYFKHRQRLTFVYGTTFEYCEFISRNESRPSNPVAALVYNYAKHNFPQVLVPCPVFGIFNISNLSLDENMIPPFVTPGGYYASQRFHDKRNETILKYETEFYINVKRFQCKGTPYEISKLHYCQLETFRNGTQVIGVLLEIMNNLHKVYATGGLYIQYFRARTQLLATTLEYCQHNKYKKPIENAATKFALDYAQQHIPQILVDCPVKTGYMFNITGVRIDDTLIPAFVLPGSYYVELRVYNKRNQTVYHGFAEVDIK